LYTKFYFTPFCSKFGVKQQSFGEKPKNSGGKKNKNCGGKQKQKCRYKKKCFGVKNAKILYKKSKCSV